MNRREFLNSLFVGAAALGAASTFPTIDARAQATGSSSPLRLAIANRTIEVNGKAAKVFGLLQPDGTQGVVLDAGTDFDIALANELAESTLIHWHGLTPPWPMDGVPDNPAALIEPAQKRPYRFPVGTGGTHWMHAHTLQEQNLLAAPLIVRTAEDKRQDEQEVVILLHDFSFTPAEELLAKLKGDGGHGAMGGHGGAGSSGAVGHGGDMMEMMGRMGQMMSADDMAAMRQRYAMGGMGTMDLNDIEYDAYLANDRTLDDPEVVAVEKGGRVRLRIINGATATVFTIDTGSLAGQLIAVDGKSVQPIAGNSFAIGMGQRIDIRLSLPKEGGAHPILALREGSQERTGLILASSGASLAKMPTRGTAKGPMGDLDLEQQLRAVEPLSERSADRSLALTLTGNMAGYSWGIVGGDRLGAKRGERIEIAMRNMTMMAHPMHLHGHHFQVVDINGTRLAGALRDTVHIPPMASVTIAFDADNPGRWPLHCHHLYHMAAGMMSFVAYEDLG